MNRIHVSDPFIRDVVSIRAARAGSTDRRKVMKIQKVTDSSFARYGKVVEGYDWTELLQVLTEVSPKPAGEVIYEPGDGTLEALPVAKELSDRMYGGMPIQIGYCNGQNTKLNCLEYHRDSEVDVAADDVILLVGAQQDIVNGQYDTAKVEAFLCPKGTGVELYATTLHYAPCEGTIGEGFRVIIVLPKGTNTEKPVYEPKCEEDTWMTARNKWLLAHPEASEAAAGAHVGLVGRNLDIAE